MKSRFIMFRRSGVYYSEDTVTGKQHSLRTACLTSDFTLAMASIVRCFKLETTAIYLDVSGNEERELAKRVLPVPVLRYGVGNAREPRPILGQFQNLRRGKKLDAVRRRVAERLEHGSARIGFSPGTFRLKLR